MRFFRKIRQAFRPVRRPWMIAVEDIRTGEWTPQGYCYTFKGAKRRCRRVNGMMVGTGFRAFGIYRVVWVADETDWR